MQGNRICLKPESVELNAQNGQWINLEASASDVLIMLKQQRELAGHIVYDQKMVYALDGVVKVKSTIIEEISLSRIGAFLIFKIQPGR